LSTYVPVWLIVALASLGMTLPVTAGPALNQFEVKDLESEPGSLQFQSQNALSLGQPRRAVVETSPGSFVYDDNTVIRDRYALEMQMGLARWLRLRVGIEFEKERIDDPRSPERANELANLNLTGVALEGVVVIVPTPPTSGVGVGLLAELDASIGGSAKQFYVGPIIQARSGPWSALANLLLVTHIGAANPMDPDSRDAKLDFAYAAQVQYALSSTWAFALEGYGTIDRLGSTGTRSEATLIFGDHDLHRAGPVVYYTYRPEAKREQRPTRGASMGASIKSPPRRDDDDAKPAANGAMERDDDGPSVAVGLGVLFGLNANTPDQTLKLSVEVNF
jgi:hypothetical protein